MDIIYLHDLRIDCIIGIWDWERQTTQRLRFDLDMGFDNRRAAASDRIEDTINYKSIARRVTAFVNASQFHLVETLAEQVAELLMREFQLPWVRVRLNKKGAIHGASDVGVMIERGTPTG